MKTVTLNGQIIGKADDWPAARRVLTRHAGEIFGTDEIDADVEPTPGAFTELETAKQFVFTH